MDEMMRRALEVVAGLTGRIMSIGCSAALEHPHREVFST